MYEVCTSTSADHNIAAEIYRPSGYVEFWDSNNIIETQNGGYGKKKKKIQCANTTFETSFLSLKVPMLWFNPNCSIVIIETIYVEEK